MCKKVYARTISQVMGQLFSTRLTPAPPFTYAGADFTGPTTLKKGHTRKPIMIKGYVCILVCLTTKAVHKSQLLICLLLPSLRVSEDLSEGVDIRQNYSQITV